MRGVRANPDADRAWMKWDRPSPFGGVTIGYRIVFLPSELAVEPEHRPARPWKGVEFVPGAPEGCVTIATVTLNDPGAHMAVDGAIEQHHGFLPLPDGGRVQLTLHTEPLGEDFCRSLAAGYRESIARATAAGVDLTRGDRLFMVGRGGPDASPFAAEANVHRPEPDPLRLADP